MAKTDLTVITGDLKHETDKAWLVNDGDKEYWLPKSQCEAELISGDTYEFSIPEWLAEDKGIT